MVLVPLIVWCNANCIRSTFIFMQTGANMQNNVVMRLSYTMSDIIFLYQKALKSVKWKPPDLSKKLGDVPGSVVYSI